MLPLIVVVVVPTPVIVRPLLVMILPVEPSVVLPSEKMVPSVGPKLILPLVMDPPPLRMRPDCPLPLPSVSVWPLKLIAWLVLRA